MPDYLLRADECPAPMVPSSLIVPASELPEGYEGVVSGALPWTPQILRDAARMQATSRYGGGAYAVCEGLELGTPTGLTVPVSAGQAMVDCPATVATVSSIVAVDNARTWVWLTRAGQLVPLTGLDPPEVPAALLGSVLAASGVVTSVDYSGRLELRFGSAWRRTYDVCKPADTPPAAARLITRTQGGVYLWDGTAYWCISGPTVVTLAPFEFTLPALAANYRVQAALPASFRDVSYSQDAIADGEGVIVYPDSGWKAVNRCAWIVYVKSDAPSGYYPGALNVRLSPTLAGPDWTGASLANVAATWTGPVEVL